MTEQSASRTAVIVCQGRAVAHERIAKGRFADPTALPLLRPDEQEQVFRVRSESPPKGMSERMTYEMIKAGATLLVPRTLAIDDAVTEHDAPQVVILGAGLDGRAWRLPALSGKTTFEVDQPASQREKRDRATALPAERAPRYVPVDFGQDKLSDALAEAGHDATIPTTWVWEGVVPYLTPDEVETTVAEVAARSAPHSRLIVNYQAPSVTGAVVRRLLGPVLKHNPWAAEPWRSAWSPEEMAGLLARHGFTVRADNDLLTTAAALDMPSGVRSSQRNGRLAVAEN
nr:class I SAM-dependent methyltransferase [uncultured Actinoplanes sp.]